MSPHFGAIWPDSQIQTSFRFSTRQAGLSSTTQERMLGGKASASVLGHNYKSTESTWSGLNALPTKIYLTREQNYFDVSPVHRKVSLLLSQKKSLPDRSGKMMYSLSFLDCDALFDDGDLRAVSKKNQRVGKLERERFKMRDCRKFNIGTGTISRITTFSCVTTTEKTYSDDKVSMCPVFATPFCDLEWSQGTFYQIPVD